jgi:hypothetical protein
MITAYLAGAPVAFLATLAWAIAGTRKSVREQRSAR